MLFAFNEVTVEDLAGAPGANIALRCMGNGKNGSSFRSVSDPGDARVLLWLRPSFHACCTRQLITTVTKAMLVKEFFGRRASCCKSRLCFAMTDASGGVQELVVQPLHASRLTVSITPLPERDPPSSYYGLAILPGSTEPNVGQNARYELAKDGWGVSRGLVKRSD